MLHCGQGSISSSIYDGSQIYVAGGNTTINGTTCKGAIRAMNPSNGAFIWQTCLGGTVMGAITMVPGVLAVVDGANLTLVNSSTGAILYNNHKNFYGSPTISNGVLYVGSTTLDVDIDLEKLGASGAVSTLVQAQGAGAVIVAERPQYFIFNGGQGGTDVIGYTGSN